MGYFYGPLWLFFILEMYWAYQTYKKLKQVGLEERELNIFKKILLFPIILLVTGIFATSDLIYDFATGTSAGWLDGVSLVLLSTHGLFTSIVLNFLDRHTV